ncbi:hypothetical protein Glove_230g22 [Diversispora epigaea]|uniref:Uncharacterized protein n=1 Tax=Diversispora epigaea TaxID=1348612 RepID=A0A397ICI6_9GLOM|nr:hypothetical protein Glove_230g22 [Diversispora epigaea]
MQDIENQQWKRNSDNFVNLNDVLNEWKIQMIPKKRIYLLLPYIAPKVLSGEKNTQKLSIYGLPDIPHDKDLDMKIRNGLRPKIPFHAPNLITRMIVRWDARVTHRPTFRELKDELRNSEEFSANQESTHTTATTTTTPINYQTHPQAIYTSRLNFSNVPKTKNEENFEKSTKSFYQISSNGDDDDDDDDNDNDEDDYDDNGDDDDGDDDNDNDENGDDENDDDNL